MLNPDHDIYAIPSKAQGIFQEKKQEIKKWEQVGKEEDCEKLSSGHDTAIAIPEHP